MFKKRQIIRNLEKRVENLQGLLDFKANSNEVGNDEMWGHIFIDVLDRNTKLEEQIKLQQTQLAIDKLEEVKKFCLKKRTPETVSTIQTINVDNDLHRKDNLLDKINKMIEELKNK